MFVNLPDCNTNVAELLATSNMFIARQEYVPTCSSITLTRSSSLTILPSRLIILVLARLTVSLAPFVNVHSKVGRGKPAAEHVKVTLLPCISDKLSGDCKIIGITVQIKTNHNDMPQRKLFTILGT